MTTHKKRTIFHRGGIKFQISGGAACAAAGEVPFPKRKRPWRAGVVAKSLLRSRLFKEQTG